MTDEERAIHLLIARCHEAIAGKRMLTRNEKELIRDLTRSYRKAKRKGVQVGSHRI